MPLPLKVKLCDREGKIAISKVITLEIFIISQISELRTQYKNYKYLTM